MSFGLFDGIWQKPWQTYNHWAVRSQRSLWPLKAPVWPYCFWPYTWTEGEIVGIFDIWSDTERVMLHFGAHLLNSLKYFSTYCDVLGLATCALTSHPQDLNLRELCLLYLLWLCRCYSFVTTEATVFFYSRQLRLWTNIDVNCDLTSWWRQDVERKRGKSDNVIPKTQGDTVIICCYGHLV